MKRGRALMSLALVPMMLAACFVPAEVVVPVDDSGDGGDGEFPFSSVVQVSALRNFGGEAVPQRFTGWWLSERLIVTSLTVVTTCDECPVIVETANGEQLEATPLDFSLEHDMLILEVDAPVVGAEPLTLATRQADDGELLAAIGHPRAAAAFGRWWGIEAAVGETCIGLAARELFVSADEGMAGAPVVDACGRLAGQVASSVSWPTLVCSELFGGLDEGFDRNFDWGGAGERSAVGTRHYVPTPDALSWLLSFAPGAAVDGDVCARDLPDVSPESDVEFNTQPDLDVLELAEDVVWWSSAGLLIATDFELFVTSADVGYELVQSSLMAGILTGEIDIDVDEFDLQTAIVETPITLLSPTGEVMLADWAALDESNLLAWLLGEEGWPAASARSGDEIVDGDEMMGAGLARASGDGLTTWSAVAEVVDGRIFVSMPTARGGHIVFARNRDWVGVSVGCSVGDALGQAQNELVLSVPLAPGCAQEIVEVGDALEALLDQQ